MIQPGATLGMLGGGQLGRMFILAALSMGYEVVVLDPDPDSPAGRVASRHLCAPYDDPAALAELAASCAAVTTEFENVPAGTLSRLAERVPVRPGARAVALTQDRIAEKTFVREIGLPTAPFAILREGGDEAAAGRETGFPAILKISRFGYDGKGQVHVEDGAELGAAFAAFRGAPCVLEGYVDIAQELSVVLARGEDGLIAYYPIVENHHRHGILDYSVVPARCPEAMARECLRMATRIAEGLDYCGVMAVEFFVTRAGEVLVNEIAPRPHNSGHYSMDACVTGQFEQQLRVLCGLPLGETRLLSPVVMVNLLGDLWEQGPPPWERLLRHPQIKLHLYSKQKARPGRKMGHYNCLVPDVEGALGLALRVQEDLRGARSG